MEHNTPLAYHFKDKHIWFDMALLAALFVVASYIPLLKIVPLVASLELFSFFSFHLLTKRSRFQMQGFLGGFISSTAVFLQVLNDKKFSSTSGRELLTTMLFAVCAMLIECLFILFYLTNDLTFIYYLPFLTQLIFFGLAILYINFSKSERFAYPHTNLAAVDIELLNDHPIIWKNVVKLSLIISAIMAIMHYIGSGVGFSREISTLLISFFEAHAILASVMTEWTLHSQNMALMQLFFLILLGNTLSKSYFALRGNNLSQKRFFVSLMFASFATSIGVTFIGSQFMEVR